MNIKKMILKVPGVRQLQTERIRAGYQAEEREKKKNYETNRFKPAGKDGEPLVSIIILNRNGMDKLRILMESMHRCQFYENFEIVFVDNASTDDSVSYMEQWKKEMQITIIRNSENMTFSEANNLGVRSAKGDYLVFLNNDTQVTDGWLDALLKVAVSNEKVGAVGARLIYPRIPKNEQNASKSFRIQHAGISFKDVTREKLYFIQPYNMGNGRNGFGPASGFIERACVTAAVLLVSRKAFEDVDGFDEKYIYGYEDVDLCLKLYKKGYHNYYNADCMVYHYEFGTQNGDDKQEVKDRRRHNMEVFKGKWQRYLFREILKNKLDGEHLFTEAKLSFLLVLPKGVTTTPEAEELRQEIGKKGYAFRVLNREKEEKEYTVGVTTDVLISFDPEYDIAKLKNTKNDLFTVAWVSDENRAWQEKDSCLMYEHRILTEQHKTVQDKVAELLEVLSVRCEDVVNPKEIDICGAMPDNDTTKFWGDYHYAEALAREFEKRGYTANVLTRENWYNRSSAKYTLVLRGLKPYYPSEEGNRTVMMWNISHPADVMLEEYNLYQYVFFASNRMKEEIGPKIRPDSGVLMQCTDPEIMSSEESPDKKYELLFVGNSRHVYRRILKDLLPTEFHLTVYGRHWEEYPVQDYVVKDYIDNNKVGQAYHDARILLNDHWEDMIQYGIISNRVFDALAAGAFVISDDMPELKEVFQGAVVTYQDRDDLNEKIAYYLEHEEERNEKAALGHEIVLKHHTFADRVEQILDVISRDATGNL